MPRLHNGYKPIYQLIMNRFCAHGSCVRKPLLYLIYHEPGYLRCQYRKVVGGYYKDDSDKKTVTVFPEIFIEGR